MRRDRPAARARRVLILRPAFLAVEAKAERDSTRYFSPGTMSHNSRRASRDSLHLRLQSAAARVTFSVRSRCCSKCGLGFHQHLAKLEAIAGRIAENGELHHAGNFFRLAFEFHAARFKALAFAFDIVDTQNDRRAMLFRRVLPRRDADGCFILAAAIEFGPTIYFERFLEAKDVAVEFLGLLEIVYVKPCD